jgi:hypothetical protein
MAWTETMVTMLRVLINDLATPETYTDERLQQVLVVAATYVQQEIEFNTTYTIDIGTPDISPDPTLTATKDDVFTNFTVLKAACIIDTSQLRTEALRAGVEARCGPAMVKILGDRLAGFKILLDEGACAAYQQLKLEYTIGNAQAVKAVLSPFVGNNFDPTALNTYPPYSGAMFE